MSFQTPILFLIFNRPETTQRIFAAIREVKPQNFFISADGPREGVADDIKKCTQTREIISQVDWDCDVQTRFNNCNLGCREAVTGGISWFFEQVEEGIILEDDVLPHPDFFRFCQELLSYYRDDKRIMLISGNNFQGGKRRTDYSYYFSHFAHIWGWATWRRAWQLYDVNMAIWPEIRDSGWLHDIFPEKRSVVYWKKILDDVYEKRIDTWDYQLNLTCWCQNALAVMPNGNLVSNIGFSSDALHTDQPNHWLANIPMVPLAFPLRHPNFIIRDSLSDAMTAQSQFSFPNKWNEIYNKFFAGRP